MEVAIQLFYTKRNTFTWQAETSICLHFKIKRSLISLWQSIFYEVPVGFESKHPISKILAKKANWAKYIN